MSHTSSCREYAPSGSSRSRPPDGLPDRNGILGLGLPRCINQGLGDWLPILEQATVVAADRKIHGAPTLGNSSPVAMGAQVDEGTGSGSVHTEAPVPVHRPDPSAAPSKASLKRSKKKPQTQDGKDASAKAAILKRYFLMLKIVELNIRDVPNFSHHSMPRHISATDSINFRHFNADTKFPLVPRHQVKLQEKKEEAAGGSVRAETSADQTKKLDFVLSMYEPDASTLENKEYQKNVKQACADALQEKKAVTLTPTTQAQPLVVGPAAAAAAAAQEPRRRPLRSQLLRNGWLVLPRHQRRHRRVSSPR